MNWFDNYRQQNQHLFGEDSDFSDTEEDFEEDHLVGSCVKSVKTVKKTVPESNVLAVKNIFVLRILKS